MDGTSSGNLERGVTFETAYAPVGTTCPSHATLFTSKHPLAHGVVRNGLVLGEQEVTMAELLAQHGYRTAAFVSSFPGSRSDRRATDPMDCCL